MSVLSKIDNSSFILVLISIFAIVAISKMYYNDLESFMDIEDSVDYLKASVGFNYEPFYSSLPDPLLNGCPNAATYEAQDSYYEHHDDRGCDRLTSKGQQKCEERHIWDAEKGEWVYCEWDDGECVFADYCDDGGDDGGDDGYDEDDYDDDYGDDGGGGGGGGGECDERPNGIIGDNNTCYYPWGGNSCEEIENWKKCDATRGDNTGDPDSGRYIENGDDPIFCKWIRDGDYDSDGYCMEDDDVGYNPEEELDEEAIEDLAQNLMDEGMDPDEAYAEAEETVAAGSNRASRWQRRNPDAQRERWERRRRKAGTRMLRRNRKAGTRMLRRNRKAGTRLNRRTGMSRQNKQTRKWFSGKGSRRRTRRQRRAGTRLNRKTGMSRQNKQTRKWFSGKSSRRRERRRRRAGTRLNRKTGMSKQNKKTRNWFSGKGFERRDKAVAKYWGTHRSNKAAEKGQTDKFFRTKASNKALTKGQTDKFFGTQASNRAITKGQTDKFFGTQASNKAAAKGQTDKFFGTKGTNKGLKKAFGRMCFVANTRILMNNGQFKHIQNLNIGDKLWNNNTVTGTMQFSGKNANLVNNSGIISTFDHHVLHNGTFKKSGLIPGSQKISDTTEFLYDIDTENHRIVILNDKDEQVTYTDFTEVDDPAGNVYKYELALLNYKHNQTSVNNMTYINDQKLVNNQILVNAY